MRAVLLRHLTGRYRIDGELLAQIAIDLKRKVRTAERAVRRYQTAGLFGLTAMYNPEKLVRHNQPSKHKPVKLNAKNLMNLNNLAQRLGEPFMSNLLSGDLTTADIKARAQQKDISERTLWTIKTRFEADNPTGLLRKVRADAGEIRGITPEMVGIVKGFIYSSTLTPLTEIQKDSQALALDLGLEAPSIDQVRAIRATIPPGDLLLAKGRDDKYYDRDGLTALMPPSRHALFLIDGTKVDELYRDARPDRSRFDAVRLYLYTCIERICGGLFAFLFSYDRADRHTIAMLYRLAFEDYGLPWGSLADGEWAMDAIHVRGFLRTLGVRQRILRPYYPKGKGGVEKVFDLFNMQFFSKRPGYVGSNTEERPGNVEATDTISEVASAFSTYASERYNQEPHGNRPFSPAEYLRRGLVPLRPITDMRQFDVLLMEEFTLIVQKNGVEHDHQLYVARELGAYTRLRVKIRVPRPYVVNDYVEVFDLSDKWICRALNFATEAGKAFWYSTLPAAQRQQLSEARDRIAEAKDVLAGAQARVLPPLPPTEPSPKSSPDALEPGSESAESK